MDKELSIIDFSNVKKKRPHNYVKKVEKAVDNADLNDFILTKKKPKEDNKENESLQANLDVKNDGSEYNYDFLLERIYGLIKKHNPNMISSSKVSIPLPVIHRVGTNRTAWLNFSDICSCLNRPNDHLYLFIISELGVQGNLGGEGQFLLKGRVASKQIESLIKKYVHEYVQCTNCKSSNTSLKRDNSARLQMLSCTACGSEKSVQPIKTGVSR